MSQTLTLKAGRGVFDGKIGALRNAKLRNV